MFSLFGKKKEEPTPKDSIIQLRSTLETLEKREAHLQKKIDKELASARANSKKNRKAALMSLKRKKVYENQMEQIMGSRMTLETQIMALEQASLNVDVMDAARAGARGLQNAHRNMNIDDVEDTMDDIRDQMDIANEIGQALSQPIGMGMDMDDDELMDELDELEQQAVDDEFLDVTAPTTALPNTAMPATPNHVPAASSRAPVETDEERELRELEASMMA